MTAPGIGIVDYQMGNLRSVEWAFAHLGARPIWVRTPADMDACDIVVLPGVGAFPRAMRELAAMELEAPLAAWLAAEKPFLGICLGFQLLFEHSEEDTGARGFGAFPGRITRLPATDAEGARYKIPQIGWNRVQAVPADAGNPWQPFDGEYVYFVHTFAAPAGLALPALETTYSAPLTAAVARGPIWGTQFHPERSGRVGLAVLRHFLQKVVAWAP